MSTRHVVIVGGGLAGLSAGIYAAASGFRTTIVEHNLALGGVCTAWKRGEYLFDGCIHWLTGGPFARVYEELGVLDRVRLRPLHRFSTYRDVRDGTTLSITADLPALARDLTAIAPEDGDEIQRIVEAAATVSEMAPPIEKPRELQSRLAGFRSAAAMLQDLPTLVHFRKPFGEYLHARIRNARLRRILAVMFPAEAPSLFTLMVLGYLERGWLSRPEGGSAAFRDALIASFRERGGEAIAHATVDEILVEGGRARGVRLHDGTELLADAVVSTSSTPETVFRLLGGRYGAEELRKRIEEWRMFTPIVLASYGVATSLEGLPQILHLDGIPSVEVGGRRAEQLYVRAYNDDPAFAPPGHAVIQALAETDYDWWATREGQYLAQKDAVGERLLAALDRCVPGVAAAARTTDVATPLTFWNMARSWRGAYEGWMPNADALFTHVRKKLPGLAGFYMAGQWVEPGGGVPAVCTSGRAAIQLLCEDVNVPFQAPTAPRPGVTAVRSQEVRLGV